MRKNIKFQIILVPIQFALHSPFDVIFEILQLVILLDLSEKCISISSNVRPSVSGKILYIKIKPKAITTQLNSVTPGNDNETSSE